jgi:outer membrane receptor protein involved in Fe transport
MGGPRLLFSLLISGFVLAGGPASAQPPVDDWRVRVDTGALHRWQTDLDADGEVALDAWSIRFGADKAVIPDLRLGLTAGYGERHYGFEGETGFGALKPWSNVRELRLSGSLSWKADERWNLFAVPTMRWFAEEGADLSDGQTGGLLAAASYRVNDRLSIGPGFGVFSELEDEVDWFPILAIDWKLTDRLALRTGSGFAATRGPGLSLDWRPSDQWSLSLGARYEKARFRLDDKGVAASGVGEETAVPVYLGATRRFGSHLSLSLIAGVEFAGELRLEDDDGGLIDKTRFDPAAFGGATLDLRF